MCIEKRNFHWIAAEESALQQIREALHKLPTLDNPVPGETLQIYLLASKEAFSLVLIVERDGRPVLVYFVSQALQGPEINYPILEKLVLALVYAAWHLRGYFQAHKTEVLINCPIKQILLKPETSGHLAKWAFELREHDVSYRPCTRIKGQALVDFLHEILGDEKVVAQAKESLGTDKPGNTQN